MAHVSGGIMAAYILFGINAKDLLSAVIMTAPGTILVAKMLVPETEVPATAGTVKMPPNEEHKNENFIARDCARHDRRRAARVQRGHHADQPSWRWSVCSTRSCWRSRNFAWAHGHIPFPHSLNQRARRGGRARRVADRHSVERGALYIGNLLGTRTIINEFLAFNELGKLKGALSPRTFSIATFALCGFANVGSIGMQIGGIGALVPNRRNDLAQLGVRAMLAGTMANLMSASIVSLLLR